MPEQIVGGNNGVPMSDGNGGTVDQGGAQTQGGGSAAIPGSSTSGTSGTTATIAPLVDWQAEVARANEALDLVLTQPGFFLTFNQFVAIFITAKYGRMFDGMGLDEKTKQEELDKLKEYYNTHGKQAMKKEYAKLKEAYSDAIKGFKEIVPQISSTIIDVFMPPTFTGVPNVGSKLLQVGIRILNILVAIQYALRLAKKYLDLAEEFGLQELETTKVLVRALDPMVKQLEFVQSQIDKLGAVFNKDDADEMNRIMKNKLIKNVSRRLDKMTDVAEEVIDNIADGESTADNRKLVKRFYKLYIANQKEIDKGVNAMDLASDNNPLGNKDFETLNQLILANDLRGQIETIVGGTLTESRAKSIQNKYKLEESVITHVNKLIDDYMKEDTTLQILEYGKQLGFKINNK